MSKIGQHSLNWLCEGIPGKWTTFEGHQSLFHRADNQCAKYGGHSNLTPESAAMQNRISWKLGFFDLVTLMGCWDNKYWDIITKFGSSVFQYQDQTFADLQLNHY